MAKRTTAPKARRGRAAADAAPTGTTPAETGAPPIDPSDEEIRVRAYLRYLQRGGGHGLAFDDWVEAERELKTKR